MDAMDDLEPPAAGRAPIVVGRHREGRSAAKKAHAAFRAVERPLVGRCEPAMRTHEAAATGSRDRSLDGRQAEGVLAGQDVAEDAAEELRSDPVGVTSDALAAPADH